MTKVRVIVEHRPSSTPPIKLRAADHVHIHERDHEWPAFVKVTTPNGGSGWVPSRYLSATQDGEEGWLPSRSVETIA